MIKTGFCFYYFGKWNKHNPDADECCCYSLYSRWYFQFNPFKHFQYKNESEFHCQISCLFSLSFPSSSTDTHPFFFPLPPLCLDISLCEIVWVFPIEWFIFLTWHSQNVQDIIFYTGFVILIPNKWPDFKKMLLCYCSQRFRIFCR